jgi:hypothetical protein
MIKSSCLGRLGWVIAVIGFSTTLVLAQSSNSNGSEEVANSGSNRMLTGTVTCAARISHQYTCKRYDTLQSCTLSCVQAGSKYVLAVGDTSYRLHGDPKLLERFAGGKATVSGSLITAEDEIEVVSVTKPVRLPEWFEQPAAMASPSR